MNKNSYFMWLGLILGPVIGLSIMSLLVLFSTGDTPLQFQLTVQTTFNNKMLSACALVCSLLYIGALRDQLKQLQNKEVSEVESSVTTPR